MPDDFEIPVVYRGKEISFPGQLITMGYSYKIQVDVYGSLISFEPDEERNFRALVAVNELSENKEVNKELLEVIAQSLEDILK